MVLADAPFVPVATAALAAVIALLSLIIAKEQKVSEFRQAWIDALRAEVVLLISRAYAVEGMLHKVKPGDTSDEAWETQHPIVQEFNEACIKVQLRINPTEGGAIIDAIRELEVALDPTKQPPSVGLVLPIERKLVTATQAMLKANWNRVRDGEPFYQNVRKWVIWAIIFFAVVLLLWLIDWSAYAGLHHEEKPAPSEVHHVP